jgi:hypothetical protein
VFAGSRRKEKEGKKKGNDGGQIGRKQLGFEEPWFGNLKEERRIVVEWLAWSMEGSHASCVLCARKTSGKGAGEDCWTTTSFSIFFSRICQQETKREIERKD